jgi:glycosyltransferase involved in cell wall biosynthesis
MIKKGSLVAKCIFYYEKIVYGMADLVIVHSNVDRERFHGRFNIPLSKLETLYLGADDKIYYPGRKRQSKFFEVVYFGLYLPVHGVETIVRAAKILKKEKNIRFTLVGKGQTFESCLEFVERNNLGNVRMIAEVGEDPKTMDMLQQADIFLGVFQSGARIEQVLPNKVFQGLALKKAVITAKTRAVEDVCEDNVHIVYCKRGSAGSLAEKILILKNKPLLRRKIAENGYKHFKDQFSPRAIGDRLINICSN